MSSSQTSSSSSEPAAAPLALMLDVDCAVDCVIGTGRMSVKDFLRLRVDSIVRLDEVAGSDLDLRVHGVTLARGEVAVIDDDAALRITDIAAPIGVGWE